MSDDQIDPYELLCVGPFRASSAYITVADREAVADYAAQLKAEADMLGEIVGRQQAVIDGLRQQIKALGGAA